MVLCHMLLYLCGAIPLLSHAGTPVEQAFIDGQAAAQSAASGASTSVTNGTIANTVNSFNPSYYNYSGTAPEASYFMNGGGDTIAPGAGKSDRLSDRPGQSKRLPPAKLRCHQLHGA